MLNYIWGFMILVGIVYGSITGNISQVGNGIIDSAREAVNICITMLGVMALWTGIMEIAESSGLVSTATGKIRPVLVKLFPEVPKEHEAFKYISLNFIANILGLGWAATPAGLKAMEKLAELNRASGKDDTIASNSMCTFLVINISSLQLIPVNIIAYRSQYGSVNPSIVIAPAILATLVSTLAGIIFCMAANKCFTKSSL